MKYPPPSFKMPLDSVLSTSVHNWLGRELELRGIDAVIYTRYILSILQQDNLDAELGEAVFFPPSKKSLLSPALFSNSPAAQFNAKKNRKKSTSTPSQDLNAEQRKKSAAVECLLSVTDEDSGIENLVDELYRKLNAQAAKVDELSPEEVADAESSDSVISSSPEDPTERYYAAFPALSDSGEAPRSANIGSTTPAWPKLAHSSPSSEDECPPPHGLAKCLNDRDSPKVSPSRQDKQPKNRRNSPYHTGDQSNKSKKKQSTRSGRLDHANGSEILQGRTLSWDDRTNRREKYWENRQPFWRSGSQERTVWKTPRMSREKSWPEFEHYARPSFIVPKMPTQAQQQGFTCPVAFDHHVKVENVSPAKISLQEIFGTEQVSEIVPCKTLVVDGQLVRLCATSVNSNNLEKTAKVSFREAPMEELVALKLQQEVENMKSDLHGKTSAVENMAENVTDTLQAEDLTWYTDPLNQLMPKSPQPKAPLFRRNTSEQSDSEADETASLATTPIYTTLWEDVLDDNGIYIGAKLQDDKNVELVEEQMEANQEKETDSDSSDYVDMTVAAHLLHNLFDDDLIEGDQPQDASALQEGNSEMQSTVSAERLDVFRILAHDGEDTPCGCGAAGSDMDQSNNIVPSHVEDRLFVSQYKGCLIPEITQNKVPDDRPLFFLDEHELNNNSQHAKSTMDELWSTVDTCSNCIVKSNIFPSLYTSMSSVFPCYSSIWNTDSSAIAFKCNIDHDPFNKAPGSRTIFAHRYPESPTPNLFNLTSNTTQLHNAPIPGLSMLWSPVSLVDAIWGEPSLDSPPKIWDVNNARILEGDSPRERSNTLENINKYLLNIRLSKEQEMNRSDAEFIEGGLYGGTLNSDDAWSTTRSDCSEDEGICDSDATWNDVVVQKQQMIQSHSADDFRHWMFDDDVYHDVRVNVWTNKLTGSTQLLHSETSAFSNESLPPRLPHLLHVQSEPSMSKRPAKWSGGKHRLVQVKHLYKPDTSILKTLGLDSDEEQDIKTDDLDISPDRHFKPIKTPLGRIFPGQCVGDVCLYNYCVAMGSVKKEEDEDTATLTGSCGYVADCLEELSIMSSSCGSGNYQMYHGDEATDLTFIPRFRLFKQHKLIQTGEQDLDAMKELEQGLSERLLVDMKRVLTIEEEDGGIEEGPAVNITMKDLDRSLETPGDVEEPPAESDISAESAWSTGAVLSALSSPTPQSIAMLWGDADSNPDEVWPTSTVQSAISSPTQQQAISMLWGEADGTAEIPDRSYMQDSMTSMPSTSSIWGYDNVQSADVSFDNLCSGTDALDEHNLSNGLMQIPGEHITDILAESLRSKEEGRFVDKDLTPSANLQIDGLPSQGQAESYMPDVVMELSSHGITPGSVPDILLHDSIAAETMMHPASNSDLKQEHIPHPGAAEEHKPNTTGIFNLDLSFGGKGFDDGHSQLPGYLDLGQESDEYAAGCRKYRGWSLAEADLVTSTHEQLEPGWLDDSDDVFNDSGDLMFVMDPDVSAEKPSSVSPVTGTLTNYFKLVEPLEVSSSGAVYSSDLESSWLKDDKQFLVQVPQRASKPKTGSGQKPCTFFMEGNCRRSDCRFAHDTSQITCRFWEDGDCFKGITCPFLHGYPSLNRKSTESIDVHKDFSLEKEHFPELGKILTTTCTSNISNLTTNKSMQTTEAQPVEAKQPDSMEVKQPDSMEARQPDSMEAKQPDSMEAKQQDSMEAEQPDSMEDLAGTLRISGMNDNSTYLNYKNLRAKLKHKAKSLPIDVSSQKKPS